MKIVYKDVEYLKTSVNINNNSIKPITILCLHRTLKPFRNDLEVIRGACT